MNDVFVTQTINLDGIKTIEEKTLTDSEQILKDNYVYNQETIKLRKRREIECFSYTDRGELWYAENVNISEERRSEFANWRDEWLKVTDTRIIPDKPSWLD